MRKKSKVSITKVEKPIHEILIEGNVPKELVMIEWVDITQSEHCNLGEDIGLITFHSVGIIINMDKDKLDLQQTWSFNREELKAVPINPSNILLSLPRGVVKNIYRYKLTKNGKGVGK